MAGPGIIATAILSFLIASLPPVLIAIIFQKYIVMGMTSGGIKE